MARKKNDDNAIKLTPRLWLETARLQGHVLQAVKDRMKPLDGEKSWKQEQVYDLIVLFLGRLPPDLLVRHLEDQLPYLRRIVDSDHTLTHEEMQEILAVEWPADPRDGRRRTRGTARRRKDSDSRPGQSG